MVWSAGRDASDVRQSPRDVGIRLDHTLNAVSYGEHFGYGNQPRMARPSLCRQSLQTLSPLAREFWHTESWGLDLSCGTPQINFRPASHGPHPPFT